MESWPRSWVVVPRARPRARARAATSDDNLPDAPPLAHRAAQLHNQQSKGGDSSRASQFLTPDRSSKRPSKAHAPAASAPHPGMRRLETEPAAIFDRHHAREREILARYAPDDGEGVR